ncbi:PREDICTED: NADPH oxidase 5 [Wasmannia auropunctata]|uniref:NADPH oxidase 5 n=1 Tax=Wasmannia auropunctata TaxID=64793 RepID=UPI0005EE5FA5|nr:PREDICTED: NADPH oxidase 5 [Wasmannia auropunctata]XP_011699770.1 PREDICTED: NADPH oxidase 5 [Wasmannia auropunctata]XP_011699771.1 PREDICTED: NADPH oxidase 5 [Wasmannia auropunctata]XP_011699772.1 PREDICTED: NADPH oxidase 5 [Wasmannia auropunctata]XP_011699773.1 PREDICTED: NADPH oxidase 5 [Wasmannia auropunctata]
MEENIICMEEECLIEKRRMTILKECKEILQEERSGRYNKEAFRRLFHDQVLLGKLFILFDQDCDGLLKQDEWLEFLKGRLTNEKQNDFIDQIESVAYVLCGENSVNFFNFQQIFYTKGIVDKLYRLIDYENSGYVTFTQIMDMISGVSNPRPRAGFDKGNLEWLEKIFKQTVGNEGEICREEFKTIVTSKNPFFTERVFQIFDKDNSGTISLQEFLDAMHQFAGKSPNDKIRFLFKVYDIDGDGLIQLRELEHVMRACMEENGMKFSDEQIEDLTLALFEDADQGNRGAITFEALKKQLKKHEGLLENLSISIDRWLVPPQPKSKKKSILETFVSLLPYQLTKPYMKNNYVFIAFISMFMLINVALFVSRLYEYRHDNGYIMFARACGQCLNFDCAFILVLMLRQCITFLRTHSFNSLVPLDHHIYLHKMTGIMIGIFSIVHTLMHLIYCGTVIIKDEKMNSGNYTMSEWLLTSRPGYFGLVAGSAYPTGVILVIILVTMLVCSMPFVRRGGCFEIFYWSHLLFIPFWILMIFHGPNFWKWFVGPGVVYLVEKIHRLVWLRSQRGKTYISSGLLLPSKVTHLVIKRPPNFHFHPGDYVFVKIPVIARYEWHPFTISSAPEQEDYMWLHIRAVGEWTNSLYSYFEKQQIKLHCADILPAENCDAASAPRKKSFLSGKKTPLIVAQKASMESIPNTHSLDNPSFVSDLSNTVSPSHASFNNQSAYLKATEHTSELNKEWTDVSTRRDRRLHQLFVGSKMPLEKSRSMPDMQIKSKKKERLRALRDYMRSESEKSFDECQMRCARFKSLGLAYLSPQNKSLAQSFRYMRTKPTIIAFKTPSFETDDYEIDVLSNMASNANAEGNEMTPMTPTAIQVAAEEGRMRQGFSEAVGSSDSLDLKSNSSQPPINYPVGKPLEIFLDGPYGAPSSHIFRAQHAVLIATGIGVTPFASILQSIMHRYWKARHTCPKCSFSWASEIPPTVMNLRKVDFFWINRNQRSFEWFVNLLSQLEIEQAELGITMERFLEMHMYITSALQKSDMKAVGLQLALDLLHEKEKRDLITGLKTRTNAGRPNWDKVFKQLQDKKKGKITVFYCGPPQLAKILRYKCDQFGFCFRKESF